jgi:hypothetical protein
MKGRFPSSLFCGLAKLKGWRWTINSTQYANIVETSDDDVVYGALYFISSSDETDLDTGEGVPDESQKQWHEVVRMNADGTETDQTVKALMYVDGQRKDEGMIKPDYIVWIRKAIRDGKQLGLPDDYVKESILPWLPEEENEVEQDMEPVRIMFPKNAFS